MPCQHREADDADEHAAHLTDWEQRYDQLSAGRFHGGLTELQLPQMQVFVEHTSHALRQSCRVWDDAFWFGLAARADGAPARINGRLDAGPGLMTRPGGTDFELVTPDRHAIYGVVVRRPWIEAAAAAQGCEVDWTRLRGRELLPLSAVARRDWRREQQRQVDDGEAEGAARQRVRASQARRHALVARAQALVLATPEQPPSVPQLCERLHLSRRTLQYCFEDVLGLSPLQALRALRLNGARRSPGGLSRPRGAALPRRARGRAGPAQRRAKRASNHWSSIAFS
ncbi:helix-turn-helix domain-containing protein [Piscinibacter sakaiensis]